ncbi:G1 family glutamic endopeptidase [Alicyclobacillus fodiniaquatilis]|jgi:hypothetical protein|uniref:G1 family glutamic endopeptidase n=1 Tax=Alicyclobacillus fodiniaquatilis TaxID=1661150 RepID=A0ABW4JFI9_9BACL
MKKRNISVASLVLCAAAVGTFFDSHGVPFVHAGQTSLQHRLSIQIPTRHASTSSMFASDTSTSSTSMPQNTQGSGNWAGYVASPAQGANGYTSVSGQWTVPNITGSEDSVAAQWIGLGGVSSDDLLQMGTIEQFENGQAVADIFWEKLPANAKNVMTVPIGSTIDASIAKTSSGTTWDVSFTAHTPDGKTESKTIAVQLNSAYAEGVGTSAEWISEDPSDENNQLYPLANMGTVTYQSALVDGSPINATGNQVQPVALVSDGGDVLIAPSALNADGNSFTTTVESTDTDSGATDGQGGVPQGTYMPRGHGRRSGWSQHGRFGHQGNGYNQGYGAGYGYSYTQSDSYGAGYGYTQGYSYGSGYANSGYGYGWR